MNIQVLSDLHLEWFDKHTDKFNFLVSLFKKKSDILVLAGDISSHDNIINDLELIQRLYNSNIVYVYGNHECYKYQKIALEEDLLNFKNDKIHILINKSIVIDNVAFIGSTGWFDGSGGILNNEVMFRMTDFNLIYDIEQNNNGLDWGKESKKFFENELEKYSDKIKICISHNSPKPVTEGKFINSILNVCFHNKWDDLFKNYDIKYWIHGHTHDSRYEKHMFLNKNNEYNNSTIICNPYGYYKYDTNKNFNKSLILTI